MENFLLSYIEDNELGVYPKEILVEVSTKYSGFHHAYETYKSVYPTMFGLKQVFGKIEDRWRKYYTHESQDQLRRAQLDMEKNLKELYNE